MDSSPSERVALIEVLGRDGQVLRQVDVAAWPIRIGRNLDCEVVLEDPHVAAHHAELDRAADGTMLLRVGETINGVRLGRRHLVANQQCALDHRAEWLQVGQTRLRLRLASDPAPVESPLRAEAMGHPIATIVLLIALLFLLGWPLWLSMDPGSDNTTWLPLVLGVPAGLGLWCGAWALASKLFQHRFDFAGHAGVMLRVLVPLEALTLGLPWIAAAFDWPTLWQLSQWLLPVTFGLLAWRHGLRVLPQHRRGVSLSVAGITALAIGTLMLNHHQRFDRLTQSPYMTTLVTPDWRWHSAGTVAPFIEELRPLEAELKAAAAASSTLDEDDELE